MLNAHRALVLAGGGGSALEGGLLRVVRTQQGLLRVRSQVVQIAAHPEDDLLRVEDLAGIRRRAVFGAAPALDAGICLQRDELGDVLARDQAEVFIARERRDAAELTA